MPTPIREAALAAVADRLTTELPSVVLERARRAPVDTDKEPLPRLVLTGTDWEADETAEPGSTHYNLPSRSEACWAALRGWPGGHRRC